MLGHILITWCDNCIINLSNLNLIWFTTIIWLLLLVTGLSFTWVFTTSVFFPLNFISNHSYPWSSSNFPTIISALWFLASFVLYLRWNNDFLPLGRQLSSCCRRPLALTAFPGATEVSLPAPFLLFFWLYLLFWVACLYLLCPACCPPPVCLCTLTVRWWSPPALWLLLLKFFSCTSVTWVWVVSQCVLHGGVFGVGVCSEAFCNRSLESKPLAVVGGAECVVSLGTVGYDGNFFSCLFPVPAVSACPARRMWHASTQGLLHACSTKPSLLPNKTFWVY